VTNDDPSALLVTAETEATQPEPSLVESPSQSLEADTADMQAPATEDASHAEIRARMLARFEEWLDQTLAGDAPPPGVPHHLLSEAQSDITDLERGAESDLYALFSALTALTGEIRLQGRAFKQLGELLTPLAETPQLIAELRDSVGPDADEQQIPFKEVCQIMIDLHDRLQRGLQTCDEAISAVAIVRGSWWQRILPGKRQSQQLNSPAEALRDAGALTLGRLSAALQGWGVQRIGEIGEPFDPRRMSAVEVREDDSAMPGTVLAVQRSGYALNGNVKATAQVTVSKAQKT